MRNSFFRALIGLALVTAVTFESIAQKLDNEAYVKQNLALVDARVRSIDKEFFVKELLWVDFGKSGEVADSVDFQDEEFADDGIGNDLVKGDGIYTSLKQYEHNANISYNEELTPISVMKEVITDNEFLYENSLQDYMANYSKPGTFSQAKFYAVVVCDVSVCICKLQCLSCNNCFSGVPGYTSAICLKLKNCKVEVGWK